jgi:hypothetical protein
MFFGFFILTRILFVASMVFIIGYVFGNFSKNKTLAGITKVASILVILLFFSSNIFMFRAGRWMGDHRNRHHFGWHDRDSLDNDRSERSPVER